MRCFSALKQKCISDFFVYNAGAILSNLKQKFAEAWIETMNEPICEGQLVIIRLKHLMVTIVAIWMANDWITNWNIFVNNVVLWHFIHNEISLMVNLKHAVKKLAS